jgi:asparagine synthetase B (glutamine-hydrolysing)
MCGISVIVALTEPAQDSHSPRGNEEESALKKTMEESLRLIQHRGPDFQGIWISDDRRIGTATPFFSFLDDMV